MKQLGFYIDAAKCTGCKTCVVACKDAHDLPVGMNLRKVIEYAGGGWRQDRMTGAWHQDVFAYYLSIACNHCEMPACMANCATGAIAKDDETGIVTIDQEACIGCKTCIPACPYGAPTFVEETGLVTKCDMCADEIAALAGVPGVFVELGGGPVFQRPGGPALGVLPLAGGYRSAHHPAVHIGVAGDIVEDNEVGHIRAVQVD